MSEGAQKTIIATLKAVSEEEKGGKDVVVYQIMRDGMKYPDYITQWPDEDEPAERADVRNGYRYAWTIMAKPKGEGKKGEYLDFLSVSLDNPDRGTPQKPAKAVSNNGAKTAPAKPAPASGGTGSQYRSIPELNRIDGYKVVIEYLKLDPEAAKAVTLQGLHDMALEIARVIETGQTPEEQDESLSSQ